MEARERVRAYRKSLDLTQSEFAELLEKELGLGYTTSLVSYAEKGVVDFPEKVVRYCDSKIDFKPFINEFDGGLGQEWTTIPPRQKKSLKTAIPSNWRDKGLKQTERVLGYIEEQGSITTKEAFDILGIARLASRICDLSKEGYEFDRKHETCTNRFGKGASYIRYSLRKEEDGTKDLDRQRDMV